MVRNAKVNMRIVLPSFLFSFLLLPIFVGCNNEYSSGSDIASLQSNPGEESGTSDQQRNRIDPRKEKEKKIEAKVVSEAQFKSHIEDLEQKYGPKGFHVVLQKPFVVIGDESKKDVKSRATGTVKWAVDKLKSKYFSHDPDHIITIWLLKNKRSYESMCKELIGEKATTPFGFYRQDKKILVMNISTGGGTLVHEIVHPFIARNFKDCPSWFNEGLASLYEQSNSRNNQIIGLTNWRLSGLQKAIIDDKVPSFETLCSTSTYQFYNQDSGTNYSQARYLCYYLQEKNLLKKYFVDFKKNVKSDPTGYKTLMKTLGTDDMPKFKKQWEKYVLRLRF